MGKLGKIVPGTSDVVWKLDAQGDTLHRHAQLLTMAAPDTHSAVVVPGWTKRFPKLLVVLSGCR